MSTGIRIAPSLLSADFARLGEEVRAVIAGGADLIHFDVMDNHYVPNLTMGPLVCEAIRPWAVRAPGPAVPGPHPEEAVDGLRSGRAAVVDVPIDVHLMVKPVDALIPMFAKAGAGIISFHPEASDHVHRTVQLIKSLGVKAGLVLNPGTPLSWLDHVIDDLDLVLLMTVNPGFGGQSFIDSMLPKITATRRRIDAAMARTGRAIWLEVDGGVKIDNAQRIAAAGADTFVAGSAVFSGGDYARAIGDIRSQADTGQRLLRPESATDAELAA